jgi:aromatic ring-opening dioxygenase LigB subunit
VTLVFAAIAPHGDLAVEEACSREQLEVAVETRAAMAELARRFRERGAEATIVVTPHNVHVEKSFAVVLAASLRGSLDWFLPEEVNPLLLECTVDRELAHAVLAALGEDAIPAVGASFGGNNPNEALMPLDWGTLVPLWHFGAREDPAVPAVVVSPARDRPLEEHIAAGAAIARAAHASAKPVALIASCDHGHAHDPDGRYGYDPAAEQFDRRVVELVRTNRLEELLELEEIVGAAAADSLWQMVMLHGALGDGWRSDFLSYEAPTYYGMLCAAFGPK